METAQPSSPAEQEQAVEQWFKLAAKQMYAGKSDAQVQACLVEQGASDDAAQAVVSELRPGHQKTYHEAARKDRVHGGQWLGGGLLVTGVTYAMAAPDGGSYFMTWGAIIFGGFQFLKGLVRSQRN